LSWADYTADGSKILQKWLDESHRDLQPEQKSHLLGQFSLEGSPLYLRLAFEEARRWKSYDGLPCGADEIPGLSPDIPGILKDLFWRLSQETNHGQLLVSRSLGYLAAARYGLSEDEMLDILSIDEAVGQDFLRRSPRSPSFTRLPVVIWSRLYLRAGALHDRDRCGWYQPDVFLPPPTRPGGRRGVFAGA
jgi:hypothetical protein